MTVHLRVSGNRSCSVYDFHPEGFNALHIIRMQHVVREVLINGRRKGIIFINKEDRRKSSCFIAAVALLEYY